MTYKNDFSYNAATSTYTAGRLSLLMDKLYLEPTGRVFGEFYEDLNTGNDVERFGYTFRRIYSRCNGIKYTAKETITPSRRK